MQRGRKDNIHTRRLSRHCRDHKMHSNVRISPAIFDPRNCKKPFRENLLVHVQFSNSVHNEGVQDANWHNPRGTFSAFVGNYGRQGIYYGCFTRSCKPKGSNFILRPFFVKWWSSLSQSWFSHFIRCLLCLGFQFDPNSISNICGIVLGSHRRICQRICKWMDNQTRLSSGESAAGSVCANLPIPQSENVGKIFYGRGGGVTRTICPRYP